ncbi:MAG TPA: glycosyltransferase [Solirubrobacteraceae bacterium]|nr:glycosyltransferase [Solirubrobacteraceae bacterium]
MRALVVSNMRPSPDAPARGSFVRDQVRALRALDDPGLELEAYEFGPGGYWAAARDLRRRHRRARFDVVHAHFGLTAWPALAVPARVRGVTLHGTDVHHPRSRALTRAVLPFLDLVATASADLTREVPRAPGRHVAAVLPCGVATDRFVPRSRQEARAALGLAPDGRYLLFGADPARPEKRYDRAVAVAERARAQLLVLGRTAPEEVPLWVNAANAVVVPSEREGFGLAVLEALACDVPVAATPTGIHAAALAGLPGTLCAAFDLDAWCAALAPHLASADPRIAGRSRALEYGADRMAARVLATWRGLLERA